MNINGRWVAEARGNPAKQNIDEDVASHHENPLEADAATLVDQ